jgi:hypothetical protein
MKKVIGIIILILGKSNMRFFYIILFLFLRGTLVAQNPVNWSYSATKTGDKTYEVHLTATIGSPWHIYSSTMAEGGPVPTTISFTKNPLISLNGKIKEVGTLIEKYEEVFEMKVKYYEGKVDFVQVVKLKGNGKTNLNGKIEYMVCTDEQCLPPLTQTFTIALK